MNRRTLAVCCLGVAVVIGVYATTRRAPAYNVLLITLDTTRADHLGCHDSSLTTTPRMDELARRGVVFSNAMCSASVTPVSHASILSGQHPYTHGLRVLHGVTENRLPPSTVTLAEALRDEGYATAAFISAFPAGSRFGLEQGFDTFDEDFLTTPMAEIVSRRGAVNTGTNQRGAAETTDRALQWLESRQGPFFAWLHYFDPHDVQLLPPAEYLAEFPPVKGSPRQRLKAMYDIEIQYMDRHIGRVFDALEAAGRWKDTVVVIVSDHGEGLGDHDWWTHGILYSEQLHSPMIIHAPEKQPGRRVDHLVRTIDVVPTVLELVGINPSSVAEMDGVSLVPQLDGDTADPGLRAYADSVNMLTYTVTTGLQDKKNDMLFAVMDSEWKYIHHALRTEDGELFHLTEDPGELNNLYHQRPDMVKRLLDDLRSRPFAPDPKHGRGRMSKEDMDRLRSLGYGK